MCSLGIACVIEQQGDPNMVGNLVSKNVLNFLNTEILPEVRHEINNTDHGFYHHMQESTGRIVCPYI